MASTMGCILRKAYRKKDDKLNILTFPTHERYQEGLAKTGHNFFLYQAEGVKEWNTMYAPLPANHILLAKDMIPPLDFDFDIILSQNKSGQFPIADYYSKKYHCPIITLEHTLPPPEWNEAMKEKVKSMKGHVNVFISEYSTKQWGEQPFSSVVIHHGIDTNLFCVKDISRKDVLLSVVNDWPNRDWCCGFNLWKKVTKDLPVDVSGHSPGFSTAAKDINELVSLYQQSSIFVNTSLISPVPTSLLEAMSCGCAIVTTATCMIPEIITHGVNGLISNNPEELRSYCEKLLSTPALARKLGKAARKTVLERFPMSKFVESWDNLFTYTADNIFVR